MKKLNATQAYKVIRLAAIATAAIAAVGIGSWTVTSSMSSSGGKGGNIVIQTDETTGPPSRSAAMAETARMPARQATSA
ncbi:hypothetical protein [Bradyrhizobium sp. S3.3.6]|uniref:hypothetical protein n=1 Tax=Bradyrhizobium sp. S3.3.6 TaxID=3156429 RepID=UPI003395B351